MSDALAYMHGSHIPRLRGVRNYFNNSFVMYTHVTCSRIRLDLASPAYLELRII